MMIVSRTTILSPGLPILFILHPFLLLYWSKPDAGTLALLPHLFGKKNIPKVEVNCVKALEFFGASRSGR
jgi:hypothetical protein